MPFTLPKVGKEGPKSTVVSVNHDVQSNREAPHLCLSEGFTPTNHCLAPTSHLSPPSLSLPPWPAECAAQPHCTALPLQRKRL